MRRIVTIALLALATPATAVQYYTLHDLGTFGGAFAFANAVNDGGDVVGHAFPSTGAYYEFYASGATGATVFTGGDFSLGSDINNSGQSTGFRQFAGNRATAYRYTPGSGFEDLGTLGGFQSTGQGINAGGTVVGDSYRPDTRLGPHAFVARPGQAMVDLGTLTGTGTSAATDINDAEAIVGNSRPDSGNQRAFLYTLATGMTDLGTLGGAYSAASSINNSNWVTGFAQTATGEAHAALWRPGMAAIDLGILAGGTQSFAQAINDAGVIVGSVARANGRASAFVYDDGAMAALATRVVNGDGWSIEGATGINARGQIVGYALFGTVYHAVRFDPGAEPPPPPPPPPAVPEPAMWVSLMAGFGMCGTALRRRRPTAA